MSNELAPPQSLLHRHFELLEARLTGVPELRPAFAIFEETPGHASEVYMSYVDLIGSVEHLSESDLGRIAQSQQLLNRQDSESGSASKVGANDLLAAVGSRKSLLADLAAQSFDPSSPYYQPTVDSLVAKMEGGHKLKAEGKTPSDHDPESLKVIWGHTLITGDEALLHFTVCHYLGLYFSEALSAEGIELASQKDFFVNALTDVVILNHLKPDAVDPIFEVWVTPKESGGMGWITDARLKSYE